jgi:hypothetical protein
MVAKGNDLFKAADVFPLGVGDFDSGFAQR